eukprot:1189553-Prorocentrum_minimum.AAC.1
MAGGPDDHPRAVLGEGEPAGVGARGALRDHRRVHHPGDLRAHPAHPAPARARDGAAPHDGRAHVRLYGLLSHLVPHAHVPHAQVAPCAPLPRDGARGNVHERGHVGG